MTAPLQQRLRTWWAAHIIDTDPYELPHPTVRLRQGWELEPIDPGHPWLLYLVAFLFGLLAVGGMGGCTTAPKPKPMPPGFAAAIDPPAALMAACPPLADLKRSDTDALSLRVAEVERWYDTCRHTALAGTPARAPRLLP